MTLDELLTPSYYKEDGRKSCIAELEEKFGATTAYYFCIGNIYKYCYRAGRKEGAKESSDIEKAKRYLQLASDISLRNCLFKSSPENKAYMEIRNVLFRKQEQLLNQHYHDEEQRNQERISQ